MRLKSRVIYGYLLTILFFGNLNFAPFPLFYNMEFQLFQLSIISTTLGPT
jgi:hypothetical protein